MQIKLLSWNIWCGTHLEDVISFLKNADADIIALQETAETEKGNLAEIIAQELGYEYVHATLMNIPVRFVPGYEADDMRTMKFGPAILSKHKIIQSEVIELTSEDKRKIVKADIEIDGTVLHVYSVHLKHNHQQPLLLQTLQAESLAKLASGENTIVMGDFNALPETEVIEIMSRGFQNTENGPQTPTWSVYENGCICAGEGVVHKLDYIFTSKDFSTISYEVVNSKASDHLPILAVVEY